MFVKHNTSNPKLTSPLVTADKAEPGRCSQPGPYRRAVGAHVFPPSTSLLP